MKLLKEHWRLVLSILILLPMLAYGMGGCGMGGCYRLTITCGKTVTDVMVKSHEVLEDTVTFEYCAGGSNSVPYDSETCSME